MKNYWLATVSMVAFSLIVSACGKKKDSGPAPVAARPVAGSGPISSAPSPTPTLTPAPIPAPGPGETKPGSKPGSGKEDPNKGKVQTPILEKGKPTAPPVAKPSKPVIPPPPEQKSVDNSPEQRPDQKPVGKGPSKSDGKLDPNPNQSAQDGGDQTAELLRKADSYSGSASDALRAYLQAKLSGAATPANVKFASQIQRARLRINNEQRTVALRLMVENQEVSLSGNLQANGSAQLNSSNGISGKIVCFDRMTTTKACATNVVILEKGNATAHVIVRNTAISMDTVFPEKNCMTAPCQNFYIFFRFTEVDLINSKTMKSAQLETFEVIHGRSGFKLLALSNGEEVFTIAGPLLKPEIAANENRPASTKLDSSDMTDAQGNLRKTSLNDSMTDVRILENDGNGNLHLSIKVGETDSFRMGLNRKVPETKTSDL